MVPLRTAPYGYGRCTPSDLHSDCLSSTCTDAPECFAGMGWHRSGRGAVATPVVISEATPAIDRLITFGISLLKCAKKRPSSSRWAERHGV
jgi:hypothetical protein